MYTTTWTTLLTTIFLINSPTNFCIFGTRICNAFSDVNGLSDITNTNSLINAMKDNSFIEIGMVENETESSKSIENRIDFNGKLEDDIQNEKFDEFMIKEKNNDKTLFNFNSNNEKIDEYLLNNSLEVDGDNFTNNDENLKSNITNLNLMISKEKIEPNGGKNSAIVIEDSFSVVSSKLGNEFPDLNEPIKSPILKPIEGEKSLCEKQAKESDSLIFANEKIENIKKDIRKHKHQKNRKHNKKSKKLQMKASTLSINTITATTTTTTIAYPDIFDEYGRNWRSKWSKKSGYYKLDRKSLSKYSPFNVDEIKKQSGMNEENQLGKEKFGAIIDDKDQNGRYIFESKYNFPEEKLPIKNNKEIEEKVQSVEKLWKNYSILNNNISIDSNMDKLSETIHGKLDDNFDSEIFNESSRKKIKFINAIEEVNSLNNLDNLLKYFHKPKLPKGTIRWKTKNVPIPMAYFTITITEGQLTKNRRPPASAAKRRVPGVQIYVTGLNMPTGYTQITEGNQLKNSNAAIVRTLNPRSSGPFVEFKIRVVNKYGTSCRQMCLDSSQRYRRCARKALRLSNYKRFSDPISFYQSSADAIEAQWTGRGYYRRLNKLKPFETYNIYTFKEPEPFIEPIHNNDYNI